jgi:prepilin-type N-terminal cleavage/methylation domain-containing protein
MKSIRGHGGFTLVEVLVAIGILVFGLLAAGTMQISAIRGNFVGINTSAALALASERMEDLLNRKWNDPIFTDNTANNGDLSSITAVDFEETVNLDGTPYRRIVNFANLTSPMPRSRQMTVIVTWDGNKHKVALSSYRMP